MDPKKKAKPVGIAFIVLFIIVGLMLMYMGNDAVVLAVRQKEGILTAEQVKMSFDVVRLGERAACPRGGAGGR